MPARPEKNEPAGAGALPVTLEHSLGAGRAAPPRIACTIGVFDGVHRGHRRCSRPRWPRPTRSAASPWR